MQDLKKNYSRFFKFLLPIFVLILIVLSFFWKVILKNQVPLPGDFIVGVYYPWLDYKWGYVAGVPVKNPITTDVVSYTYPMQTFAMELFKQGIWPLWNPYILTGSPLLANFQSAPFSPTSFLYFLFDKTTAWSMQIILQHLLAAAFTYFLLRYWKVSKLGAILGGIVFAFSGYNIIFSQWNGHTLASAFIPLVLLFEDRLLTKKKFSDGVLLSVFLALQFFSGYTQTSVYAAVAMGLLWLVRVWKDKQIISKTALLAVFCLFSLGLSAVQILPSLELIKNSQRSFEPHPFAWAFLPWQKVITFISSDFFGNHSTRNYWGPQDYTSNTGYIGVVAFILSMVSLVKIKMKKEIFFSFLLMVVSLLLSFPTPLSTFIWSNDILGMKANSAHRATILFTAAGALLAGFGFDVLEAKIKNKYKILVVAVLLLLLVGFGVYAFSLKGIITHGGIDVFRTAARNLLLPFGVLVLSFFVIMFLTRLKILLIGLCILELFYFAFKFTPFSPRDFIYPQTPVISFLMAQEKPFRTTGAKVIPSNIRMAYGLETVEGYDTFHPLGISRFVSAINSGTAESHPVGRYGIVDNDVSPLLDLVNTKYYLVLKEDSSGKPSPEGKIPERFDTKRFNIAFEDKSVAVLESTTALNRAFMVYDWEIESDGKKALEKLLQVNYPYSKKIVLEKDLELAKDFRFAKSTVEYLNYSPQRSILNVETEKAGLLFVSEAFYPDWQAFVDDKETEIYKANYNYRAVVIPPGKHIVRFVYQPNSFYLGLKISLFSVLILLLALGYTWLYD